MISVLLISTPVFCKEIPVYIKRISLFFFQIPVFYKEIPFYKIQVYVFFIHTTVFAFYRTKKRIQASGYYL